MAFRNKTAPQSLFQRVSNWLLPISDPGAYVSLLGQAHVPVFSNEQLLQETDHSAQRLLKLEAHEGLAGEHRTVFRGQGLDFSELREYNPGDDIRKLDWQVFARTQVPHIRQYREERQIRIWIALEWSLALSLGQAAFRLTNEQVGFADEQLLSCKAKQAMALTLCLSRLADATNAKIGAYCVSATGSAVLPPASGQAQHQRLSAFLRDAARGVFSSVKGHESESFLPLQRLVQKQDWVIVLADASRLSDAWLTPLGNISQRAHLSVFALYDSQEFIPAGELSALGLESPSKPGLSLVPGAFDFTAHTGECMEASLKTHLAKFQRLGLGPIIAINAQASPETAINLWLAECGGHSPARRRGV
ncbi:MAG: DUF58 domain-containing protein [Vampirovibrionales bacterium]|nr:DUF58 domain-containing protein [Vampirovibrionales bacterium]